MLEALLLILALFGIISICACIGLAWFVWGLLRGPQFTDEDVYLDLERKNDEQRRQ